MNPEAPLNAPCLRLSHGRAARHSRLTQVKALVQTQLKFSQLELGVPSELAHRFLALFDASVVCFDLLTVVFSRLCINEHSLVIDR